jgi:hypothetical protein
MVIVRNTSNKADTLANPPSQVKKKLGTIVCSFSFQNGTQLNAIEFSKNSNKINKVVADACHPSYVRKHK